MMAPSGAAASAAPIDWWSARPSGDTVIVTGSASALSTTRFTGTRPRPAGAARLRLPTSIRAADLGASCPQHLDSGPRELVPAQAHAGERGRHRMNDDQVHQLPVEQELEWQRARQISQPFPVERE